MLTHLRLQGFKSWRDTGDIALRPITGIFGANSSGKTSLIQALLLLKQTAESSDRNLTLHFGDRNTPTDLGDFSSAVHRHDPAGAIEVSLGWKQEKPLTIKDTARRNALVARSRDLAFQIAADQSRTDDATVSVETMAYRIGDVEFGMRRQNDGRRFDLLANGTQFQFQRPVGRPWPLPKPIKCYGFPDEARARFQNAGFLGDLAFALEERLRAVYYLGPLRAQPERLYSWSGERPTDMGRAGESAVAAMLSSAQSGEKISLGQGRRRRSLEQHVAYWLKELGLIHDFHVVRLTADSPLYQVKVRKSAGGPESLITDVGFGVSQILPVLVLCFYAPTGSTIILEQPEIHLHPSVQAGLADVLIDAHKRRDVQIIVESHSEHFLRRLQRRVAEAALPNDDLAVYFCENAGARSKLTHLRMDIFGNIANWPTDFFGDEFGEFAAMTDAAIQRRATDAAG